MCANSVSPAFLIEKLVSIRRQTELLCAPLTAEDCLISATEETSPPKWHLAHTTWFFERFILRVQGDKFQAFDPAFDYLFNSYYQVLGAYLPKRNRSLLSRPSMAVIQEYRSSTLKSLISLIEKSDQVKFNDFRMRLELGLNHEQQHQELLLMDIKRNFFSHPFSQAYFPGNKLAKVLAPSASSPLGSKQKWQTFPEGMVKIGHQGNDFHYDNETGEHRVWLDAFELAPYLVTNEEYLEFIEAKGYADPQYWLSDGWETVQKESWTAPLYWRKDSGQWLTMTFHGLEKLKMSDPVSHLSYYEAQAFAKFRNARLPTEFEWESVAQRYSINAGQFLESGTFQPRAHSGPFSDLQGELWQWTQSAYLPYPRFQPFAENLGEYNSKFMCNQFVLRGGSCVTPREHYRSTYRNFFYPDQRWQFAGLRLARDGTVQ